MPTIREAAKYFYRLLLLIRPYWVPLAKGIALTVALSLVGMVTPYISKLLIDQAYPAGDFKLMHVLVIGMLGLALSSSIFGAVGGFYSLFVSTHLNSATRLMYFNHLQHLDARFFDEHRVGEMTSRFQDVAASLSFVNGVFQMVFMQGLYILLVPPLLMWIDWRLALVSLASYPLTAAITIISGRLLRRYWKKSAEANADLSAVQIETLSNIRTFKAMALEPVVFAKTRKLMANAINIQIKASGLGQIFGTANGLIRAINTAIYTWFGWNLILSKQITLGDFMAFSAYIGYIYRPISQIVGLTNSFQQSAVSLGRAFEYLDHPVEQDPSLAYSAPSAISRRLQGAFRFDKVSFSYVPEQPVLKQVDLEIKPGLVTSLVGSSGSGKTTILRLLLRFADPQSGQILADNCSLSLISLSDLRRQISVVWQEVSLIKGTLWENLTLGTEREPSRRAVDDVVEICGLTDVLAGLPKGYETEIAEWGSSLSAGQRQRVAIARALLRDAPILLLDEATANVDTQTETRIFSRIFPLLKARTVIIVTHRLVSAALADEICVLDKSQVVGFGAHRELLATCDVYRRMCGSTKDPESRMSVVQ